MLDQSHLANNLFTGSPGAYDLIFIGGGLSGTLSLIQVLEELRSMQSAANALRTVSRWRIALIDTWGDFGGGVPYGRSVHPMLLLNNDVATMNVRGFHSWLDVHRDRWLGMLGHHSSAAVANWLQFNRAALTASEFQPEHYLPLFLPRCVFGLFTSDVLANALAQARDVPASVELVRDEVVSISRLGSGFRVGLRSGAPLITRIAMLGVGSLGPDPAPDLEGMAGYVHNVNPPGGAPLHCIVQRRSAATSKASRVAILGSHASAMEAIYTIAQERELNQIFSEVAVISPSGRLPEATSSGLETRFEPQALNGLFNRTTIFADDVIAAALWDAAEARQTGYSSIDYSPPLCSAFGRIFGRLSANEKHRFVEQFGMQFTALNRHTPPEYAAAAHEMIQTGKLRLIAAKVTAVAPPNASTSDFTVTFTPANGSSEHLNAEVVINCRGSGALTQTTSPLLRDLLHANSGIAHENGCGKGITVSEDFEASPGLFVIGPLLAGHSCGSDHLWNLERAERIDWLARRIAPAVVARLTNQRPSVSRL